MPVRVYALIGAFVFAIAHGLIAPVDMFAGPTQGAPFHDIRTPQTVHAYVFDEFSSPDRTE